VTSPLPYRLTPRVIASDAEVAATVARIQILPWELVDETERSAWAAHADERVPLALLATGGADRIRVWSDRPAVLHDIRESARQAASAEGVAWTPVLDALYADHLWPEGGQGDFLGMAAWIAQQRDAAALRPLLAFRSAGPARLVITHALAWDRGLLDALLERCPAHASDIMLNPSLPADLAARLGAWARRRALAAVTPDEHDTAAATDDGRRVEGLAAFRILGQLTRHPTIAPALQRDVFRWAQRVAPAVKAARTFVLAHPRLTPERLIAFQRMIRRAAADRTQHVPRVTPSDLCQMLTHPVATTAVWSAILDHDPTAATAITSRLLSEGTATSDLLASVAERGLVEPSDWGRLIDRSGADVRVVVAAARYLTTADVPTSLGMRIRAHLAETPDAVAHPAVRALLLKSRSPAIVHRVVKSADAATWNDGLRRLVAVDPKRALQHLESGNWPSGASLERDVLTPLFRSPDHDIRSRAMLLLPRTIVVDRAPSASASTRRRVR
jgi:hypothetical protein